MKRRKPKRKKRLRCAVMVDDGEGHGLCGNPARRCQLEVADAAGEARLREINWIYIPLCARHRREK